MPEQPSPGDTPDLPETLSAPAPDVGLHVPAEGDALTTGTAPTFRPLLATDKKLPPRPATTPLRIGDRLDDFEIIGVLGAGSFAQVYLARQVSLGRQVALKVSTCVGSEARTLASLEHEHIVRVFSETVDPKRDLRLLCIQFVPGTTLEYVIRALGQQDPETWDGRRILEAIDRLSTHAATFDPAALRDRELLAGSDFIEAVCWIGARLAEALAHAHSQGVLHRDIKPANILLNRYGRPLLADFNVAHDPHQGRGPGASFGGTLAYMAPEHLEAFARRSDRAAAVDERSDVYSLGVVLFELLTGRLPFGPLPGRGSVSDVVKKLTEERRAGVPVPERRRPGAEVLERVITRCLEPDPADRYASAAELARALDGCRDLRRVTRALPPGGVLTRAAAVRPFLWLTLLTLAPHVLASAVNITYNALRVHLSEPQRAAFVQVTTAYNLVVYPFCGWMIFRLVGPIYRLWRRLDAPLPLDAVSVGDVRRHALRLPAWAAGLSAVGWLAGGVVFPAAIAVRAGPVPIDVVGHFLVSFTIAGLIALTYSVYAAQLVALRILYPRFWADGQRFAEHTARELAGLDRRLRLLQLLAGLIPLAGAALMVTVGPESFTDRAYQAFRLLVTALILLGMAGFAVALLASSLLSRTLGVLTGSDTAARRRSERA